MAVTNIRMAMPQVRYALVWVLTLAVIAGCEPSPLQKRASRPKIDPGSFDCILDEQIMDSDDYSLTNNSPHDLSEVHITISTTDVFGETKVFKQYWEQWNAGETKVANDAPISEEFPVQSVQKVRLSGIDRDYAFDAQWTFNN